MLFPATKRAMGADWPSPAPSWGEVMSELWPVISSPPSLVGEQLLLDVIHYNGRLHLTVTTDMPHSLPPDEMLRFLAMQALVRYGCNACHCAVCCSLRKELGSQ